MGSPLPLLPAVLLALPPVLCAARSLRTGHTVRDTTGGPEIRPVSCTLRPPPATSGPRVLPPNWPLESLTHALPALGFELIHLPPFVTCCSYAQLVWAKTNRFGCARCPWGGPSALDSDQWFIEHQQAIGIDVVGPVFAGEYGQCRAALDGPEEERCFLTMCQYQVTCPACAVPSLLPQSLLPPLRAFVRLCMRPPPSRSQAKTFAAISFSCVVVHKTNRPIFRKPTPLCPPFSLPLLLRLPLSIIPGGS